MVFLQMRGLKNHKECYGGYIFIKKSLAGRRRSRDFAKASERFVTLHKGGDGKDGFGECGVW